MHPLRREARHRDDGQGDERPADTERPDDPPREEELREGGEEVHPEVDPREERRPCGGVGEGGLHDARLLEVEERRADGEEEEEEGDGEEVAGAGDDREAREDAAPGRDPFRLGAGPVWYP